MKLSRFLLLSLFCASALLADDSKPIALEKGQSRVSVDVHASVDSFTAHLDDYQANLTANPANGKVIGASFKFRFADLHTGKPARDAEMLKWEDASQFPEGKFTLTSLDSTGETSYAAHGDLTIHGVTKSIVFPVMILKSGQAFSIDGEVPLDYRDYGLPIIRKYALFKVAPLVKVSFHLQSDGK